METKELQNHKKRKFVIILTVYAFIAKRNFEAFAAGKMCDAKK